MNEAKPTPSNVHQGTFNLLGSSCLGSCRMDLTPVCRDSNGRNEPIWRTERLSQIGVVVQGRLLGGGVSSHAFPVSAHHVFLFALTFMFSSRQTPLIHFHIAQVRTDNKKRTCNMRLITRVLSESLFTFCATGKPKYYNHVHTQCTLFYNIRASATLSSSMRQSSRWCIVTNR